MERDFHLSTLWQRVDQAKSSNPTLVCSSIDDIRAILKLIKAEDEHLLDPLETAYEVADVALGLGENRLEGAYQKQVLNLIDDFEQKARKRFLNSSNQVM